MTIPRSVRNLVVRPADFEDGSSCWGHGFCLIEWLAYVFGIECVLQCIGYDVEGGPVPA